MDKQDVNVLRTEVSKLANATMDLAKVIDGRLEGIRVNLQNISNHTQEISRSLEKLITNSN